MTCTPLPLCTPSRRVLPAAVARHRALGAPRDRRRMLPEHLQGGLRVSKRRVGGLDPCGLRSASRSRPGAQPRQNVTLSTPDTSTSSLWPAHPSCLPARTRRQAARTGGAGRGGHGARTARSSGALARSAPPPATPPPAPSAAAARRGTARRLAEPIGVVPGGPAAQLVRSSSPQECTDG